MKNIALFPGQGAQNVGMGKDFYEANSKAKELFERADQILGFKISEVCFEGPLEKLTLTENVQPAILTVSTVCHEIAKESSNYIAPSAVAGHSLGEYSALVAAGALKFEDAVLLVHKRGKYMQEAVPQGSGRMMAVLGKEISEIEELLRSIPDVQIANVNAGGQVVISGSANGVSKFQELAVGWKLIELTVSAPFHCKLMEPAAKKLAIDLDAVEIKDASLPVYANFSAQPVQDANQIRQLLKDQVCGRVRWLESMQQAISDGFNSCSEYGPGSVLAGLMKRIDKTVERKNISTLADL